MLIQLLVIQAVTMALLVLGLRFIFYRHLNSALARLKRLHEENLTKEEELKKQLEDAAREREQSLAQAREEAERIVKEAREKMDASVLQSRGEAKLQAQKILDEARREEKLFREEVLARAGHEAAETALRLLRIVFTGESFLTLQTSLIASLLEEVRGLDASKFTVTSGAIKISTAKKLAPGERAAFSKVLEEKIGRGGPIEETLDEELIAGVVIRIGALTLDGSLRNRLEHALPYLKADQRKL
jgi:F0F1-type ATP synthase delta subunit